LQQNGYALIGPRLVLGGHAEPDVWEAEGICPFDNISHPFRPFGQNLKGVLWSAKHSLPDLKNKLIRHIRVEQVAHRTGENQLAFNGSLPSTPIAFISVVIGSGSFAFRTFEGMIFQWFVQAVEMERDFEMVIFPRAAHTRFF